MHARPLALVLLTVPLAACLATPAPAPLPGDGAALALPALVDGRVEVEVPVPVVLLGFAPGTAEALRAALAAPERVDQATLRAVRAFPPDPADPHVVPSWAGLLTTLPLDAEPGPLVPTGVFQVHEAPAAFAASFWAATLPAEGGDGTLDANAAEAWLAAHLAEAGVALDPDTPALVLLHRGGTPGQHAWRYTYPHGHLEPVRAFGERAPVLVLDVSAARDPWTSSQSPLLPNPPGRYADLLPEGGPEVVQALADAARNATQVRLLKGPVYPVSTAPCHAVTLVLGISTTSLTEALPDYTKAAEALDLEALGASWANLTGGDTRVDLRVLQLPQDDPVLDAFSRGNLASLDQARWWIHTHWEDYWVAHEGCEGYVSVLFFHDAADIGPFFVSGIGTYDPGRTHRISLSWYPDGRRLLTEGALAQALGNEDPSEDERMALNYLAVHETGHLFGQGHTFTVDTPDGRRHVVGGFESVWSSMSYQVSGRVLDFGAVEHNNWLRNRAGQAVRDAAAAGLEDAPEFRAALQALARRDWAAAGDALVPLLHPAAAAPAAPEPS